MKKLYTTQYWLSKLGKAKTYAQKRKLIEQYENWKRKHSDLKEIEKKLKKIEDEVKKIS